MMQRPLLHMTAALILGGGGMAWKVLASPLAQVCIYFIVSIFFFSIGFSAKRRICRFRHKAKTPEMLDHEYCHVL